LTHNAQAISSIKDMSQDFFDFFPQFKSQSEVSHNPSLAGDDDKQCQNVLLDHDYYTKSEQNSNTICRIEKDETTEGNNSSLNDNNENICAGNDAKQNGIISNEETIQSAFSNRVITDFDSPRINVPIINSQFGLHSTIPQPYLPNLVSTMFTFQHVFI